MHGIVYAKGAEFFNSDLNINRFQCVMSQMKENKLLFFIFSRVFTLRDMIELIY